jgi:hypothetical protein
VKELLLEAKQRSAPSKINGDVLPLTTEARTSTQQLPKLRKREQPRSHNRPSRRHQSRAVEVLRSVLKKPHRVRSLLALGLEGALGESGSQSRRFYRVRRGWPIPRLPGPRRVAFAFAPPDSCLIGARAQFSEHIQDGSSQSAIRDTPPPAASPPTLAFLRLWLSRKK